MIKIVRPPFLIDLFICSYLPYNALENVNFKVSECNDSTLKWKGHIATSRSGKQLCCFKYKMTIRIIEKVIM